MMPVMVTMTATTTEMDIGTDAATCFDITIDTGELSDNEIDNDVGLNIGIDIDIELDIDIDVDIDIGSDVDVDIEMDTDIDSDMVTDADTDVNIGVGIDIDVERHRMYVMGHCISRLKSMALLAGLGFSPSVSDEKQTQIAVFEILAFLSCVAHWQSRGRQCCISRHVVSGFDGLRR